MARSSESEAGTLLSFGAEKLGRLWRALDMDEGLGRQAQEIFETLSSAWGRAPARGPRRFPSDITDDHWPFEFSLAVDGGAPELRYLVEVQSPTPSHSTNWEASRAMNRVLADRYGVSLDRLSQVETLFAPGPQCRRFSMWHAVCFRDGRPPAFKVYLNPLSWGEAGARAVVMAALARLGFPPASAALLPSGPRDSVIYFSLDLSADEGARAKVYTAHVNGTVLDVEAGVAPATGYVPGKATAFCEALTGHHGPFTSRPVITCLAFVEGKSAPTTGTVHVPVRCYAPDDAEVRERVASAIHAGGERPYRRALEALGGPRLHDGLGMQTYASLRLEKGHDRFTVYLAPEARPVVARAPASVGARARRQDSAPPSRP